MRRVREDRRRLGSSADLPDMWRHLVLRQFAKPAREQTRARQWPPGHRIGGARRTVAVLFRGRRLRRVLTYSNGWGDRANPCYT